MSLLYRVRSFFIVFLVTLLLLLALLFIYWKRPFLSHISLPQESPTHPTPTQILSDSWAFYSASFIRNGQVIDPGQKVTTSEGQAYALLRAAMIDDKERFAEVYTWTRTHLLLENGLYAWKWVDSESGGAIADHGVAPDADEDIAIALLLACSRWDISAYCGDARMLIRAMWEHVVADVDGTPYFTAGDWARGSDAITLNPSYLSPAYYRIFAQVDPEHNWNGVVSSSYTALRLCTSLENGVLPPEWCMIRRSDQQAFRGTGGLGDLSYGYNAIRVPWRVALDYEWYSAPEASAYLSSLSVLDREWRESSRLFTTYTHSGEPQDRYESAAGYFGLYSYYHVTQPSQAELVYLQQLLGRYQNMNGQAYWDSSDNYYTQNLAWFATALYSGNFRSMYPYLTETQ